MSLLDRLQKLETQMTSLQDTTDGLLAQNMQKSYANVLSEPAPSQVIPQTSNATDVSARGATQSGGVTASHKLARGGGNHSARGRGGRPQQKKTFSLERAQSMLSIASALTNNSVLDDSEEEFTMPAYTKKKQKRAENNRRKFITGNKSQASGRFRGAPEPSRDLFIYRVLQEAEADDIRELVTDEGCEVRDIKAVSHPEAKYKSFKLSVPMSEYDKLISENFPWPEGVRIRMFISPRKTNDS